MKAFVFTDKALESEAGRFVWLEINTEQAVNAAFRTQYKVEALPTYFIIDPRTEEVIARRVGGATVAQLLGFLNTGAQAYSGEGQSPEDLAVARAEVLYANGQADEAIAEYRWALENARPTWTGYAATVEALLFALDVAGDSQAVAELAREAYPKLRMTAAAANLAASGLSAALRVAGDDPGSSELVQVLFAATKEVAHDPNVPVAADDRSSAFGTLGDAYEALGDTAMAQATWEAWAAFLDDEANAARTPDERTVFDSHRLSAYLAAGKPEGAIGFLKQSEQDFPDDYNPPARLAVAYKRMGDLDSALAANNRALDRVYGPRKIRVLQNQANILEAKGDTEGARQALEDALALAKGMPPGQRSERTITRLERLLS